MVFNRWATAEKSGWPRVVISVLVNKNKIAEIAQSASKQEHEFLFNFKIGHISEKAEKLCCRVCRSEHADVLYHKSTLLHRLSSRC